MKRWIRYQYLKLVRLDDTPEKIAFGAAVGVFIGVFPTFGVGTILAFALAVVFRFNRAAAILGTLIMNPFTTPFFWTLSSALGAYLVGGNWHKVLKTVENFSANFHFYQLITREGWQLVLRGLKKGIFVYLVGNTVLSSFLTFLTYPLVYKGVVSYRRRFPRRRSHLA